LLSIIVYKHYSYIPALKDEASVINPGKKGAEMLILGISAALATHGLGLLASHYLHLAV